MAVYERGNGGYTLTPAQLDVLRGDLVAMGDQSPSTPGLGVQIYMDLLSFITDANGRPLPGVDPAVYAWISGAIGVNQDSTFAGDYIRAYTGYELTIRDGTSVNAADLVNQSSNQIAVALANDILSADGELPGIEGIGAIDAGATASIVFEQNGNAADYAGWAGTLLFPYLGESRFYYDWLLNFQPYETTVITPLGTSDPITFKHVGGTYDLVAAIEASLQASYASTGPFAHPANTLTAFWQAIVGPSGATQTDQSSLVADTNSFLPITRVRSHLNTDQRVDLNQSSVAAMAMPAA